MHTSQWSGLAGIAVLAALTVPAFADVEIPCEVAIGAEPSDQPCGVDIRDLAPGDAGTIRFLVTNPSDVVAAVHVTVDDVAGLDAACIDPDGGLPLCDEPGDLLGALHLSVAIDGPEGPSGPLAGSALEMEGIVLEALGRLDPGSTLTVALGFSVAPELGNEGQGDRAVFRLVVAADEPVEVAPLVLDPADDPQVLAVEWPAAVEQLPASGRNVLVFGALGLAAVVLGVTALRGRRRP